MQDASCMGDVIMDDLFLVYTTSAVSSGLVWRKWMLPTFQSVKSISFGTSSPSSFSSIGSGPTPGPLIQQAAPPLLSGPTRQNQEGTLATLEGILAYNNDHEARMKPHAEYSRKL